MSELSPEDAKLVTLARSTRARTGAAEGAAVRDESGRTYAAATVELPSLRLTALEVCVATAIASGFVNCRRCSMNLFVASDVSPNVSSPWSSLMPDGAVASCVPIRSGSASCRTSSDPPQWGQDVSRRFLGCRPCPIPGPPNRPSSCSFLARWR